jgi:uncharacterized repeat protein (TIGR03803 family)
MKSPEFSSIRKFPHILALAALTFSLALSAHAQTETILYNFATTSGVNPYSGLIFDSAGNLYGTTYSGGASGAGTVFKLAPITGGWQETVLYSFTGGTDGGKPYYAGVILDSAGNLYGTTYSGGNLTGCAGLGCGTVFKLAPVTGGWQESVLYSFSGGADGGNPRAGVIFDAAGNLYGTAFQGGSFTKCLSGCGIAYKLTPTTSGPWLESVLHAFNGTTDGGNPHAGLIFDAAGNLYGTNYWGGNPTICAASNCGTVFRLTASTILPWKEKVLHDFTNKTDGGNPASGLTFDAAGNLYGTTAQGGHLTDCSSVGCGTIFKLTPQTTGKWTQQVIRSFTGMGDGAGPQGGVIFDAAGNLYGTAISGSKSHVAGVVFKLTPQPTGPWKQTVLHGFPGTGNDGQNPQTDLIFDAAGHVYGTTPNGGTSGSGIVFEITP